MGGKLTICNLTTASTAKTRKMPNFIVLMIIYPCNNSSLLDGYEWMQGTGAWRLHTDTIFRRLKSVNNRSLVENECQKIFVFTCSRILFMFSPVVALSLVPESGKHFNPSGLTIPGNHHSGRNRVTQLRMSQKREGDLDASVTAPMDRHPLQDGKKHEFTIQISG